MKALSSSMLALVMAALPIVCSPASTDKTLQSLGGTVTYGANPNPSTKLAKNASATLSDNDYAATGANSLAAVTLPDSSVVTMGQNSSVQMQKFDVISGVATAKFLVVGKVRFKVEHPAGAKANYTFQTPTGQIAVRGTEGDIFSQPATAGGAPGGLQVNVYALTNPALPVQVTLVNGQVFTLAAGQSLVVTAAGGALVGAVGAVSQTTFAPFTQLGVPANASSLGVTASTTAAGASAGAGAAATGAAATTAGVTATAVAVGTAAVVTTTATKASDTPSPAPTATPTASPTASPTPSPMPTGTTIPITISGGSHQPGAIPAPPTAPQRPGTPPVGPPSMGPVGPLVPGPHGLNPNPRPSPPVH